MWRVKEWDLKRSNKQTRYFDKLLSKSSHEILDVNKRFFFKSQVIGTNKLDINYAWVTKEELLEYFSRACTPL
ncbi:hypothetical protein FCM35_KLT01578 [Carex littledalei]|uniref:Uncharacterized protein n=1 Tax=Carex littledalei TaxID=544730 RepID=A0A833R532_9POAL|nr:hypothetical protein FCM35_KLT21810 [Carex littledalei]KAF3324915.1 hypothetical protein FCM35_KLT11072 [Carex littledalei]KAF3333887.1 hypothetical protein FCM35_KLT01578 [Carex littledalei]